MIRLLYRQPLHLSLAFFLSGLAYSQNTITTYAGGEWAFYGENGPATDAPLGTFLGIAADPNSNRILIGDAGNRSIFEVDAAGILRVLGGNGTTAFAPMSAGPVGPALPWVCRRFDRNGRLVFSDSGKVRSIDAEGRLQTIANLDGIPVRTLSFDKQGRLYAVANSFIARRTDAGTWENLVGPGSNPNAPDGTPASDLRTESIWGGADFDAEGRIVFADVEACRIRRVNADGRLETIAGTNECGASPDGSRPVIAQ